VSDASRPSPRASKLPVEQLVFVARGAFSRSTPCVCALRGFLPGRVFPDRTTRRHGLARPPPNRVGWAERVVTEMSCFSVLFCQSSAMWRAASLVCGPSTPHPQLRGGAYPDSHLFTL